jgi:ElaB/YqjD/DUF883 family membrane-anchored ribosome-binding protein
MQAIDRGEAKAIEENYKQIYVDAARLTAALIAEILQKLKKHPELKVELEDEKQQPKVEIKVGRSIAYRGVEGQKPEFNNLTREQVDYLADVLPKPAADKSSAPTPDKQMNRAVTIKVNDKVVYKLSKGVVEINELQPELAAEIAKSIAPPERRSQLSVPPQASPSNQVATGLKEQSPSKQVTTDPLERSSPQRRREPSQASPSSEVTTAPEANQTSGKTAPSLQLSQPAPSVQSKEALEPSVIAPSQLENELEKPKQEQAGETGVDPQKEVETIPEEQQQVSPEEQQQDPQEEVATITEELQQATPEKQQLVEAGTDSPQSVEAGTGEQQQSPSETDKFLQSLIVLERRIEQTVKEPPLKQWLNKAVEAFKEAPKKAQQVLKQAPSQVADVVRSTPDKMRDRAIAATLDLFHKSPYRGTTDNVYKAEGYAIESEGKDVYSIKNNDNREVMRFKHTVLGPRVLEVNMNPSEQRDFLQVRNQIQKYGLDDISSSDSFNQTAQLGKLAPAGTSKIKQNLVNRSVALNAFSVLENFGKDTASGEKVFEGKNYRIEQKEYGLTITAQDGRGVILQSQAGEIKANLSPKDISQFNVIGRKIDTVRQQIGKPENNSVIETAEKLVQAFGKERGDGSKVFEGKNEYRIEQNGDALTITDKNNRGVILQRENGQVRANLSPKDIEKFDSIGNEFAKRESKQVTSVIQTAKNLVQYLGKETSPGLKVFEGKNYQIQQRGNDISIVDKNERGEILRQQGGTTVTNLLPQDISKFEATGQQIEQHITAAAQRVQSRSKSAIEIGA